MGFGGGAGDAYNENPEQECPFTCLVSTATNPVLVNGGTTAVSGGTQTGGVVENWKQYYYGKLSYDATNIVAMTFTIQSPWGKSMSGVEGAVVKGWSLSGVMHFQSGSPLTATQAVNVGLSGISVTRRANIVPGQSLRFYWRMLERQGALLVQPCRFHGRIRAWRRRRTRQRPYRASFYNWDLGRGRPSLSLTRRHEHTTPGGCI